MDDPARGQNLFADGSSAAASRTTCGLGQPIAAECTGLQGIQFPVEEKGKRISGRYEQNAKPLPWA